MASAALTQSNWQAANAPFVALFKRILVKEISYTENLIKAGVVEQDEAIKLVTNRFFDFLASYADSLRYLKKHKKDTSAVGQFFRKELKGLWFDESGDPFIKDLSKWKNAINSLQNIFYDEATGRVDVDKFTISKETQTVRKKAAVTALDELGEKQAEQDQKSARARTAVSSGKPPKRKKTDGELEALTKNDNVGDLVDDSYSDGVFTFGTEENNPTGARLGSVYNFLKL
jgi:hypothetical protein